MAIILTLLLRICIGNVAEGWMSIRVAAGVGSSRPNLTSMEYEWEDDDDDEDEINNDD